MGSSRCPVGRGSPVSITLAPKDSVRRCSRSKQLHAGRGRGYDNDRNSNDVDDGAHRAPEEPDRCRALMRADRLGDRGEPQRRHRQANRLGLSRFKSAAGTKSERTGTPKIARPGIITQHKNLRALWAKPQIAFGEVSGDSANRCSLFELQQWHCRWPISEPGAEDFGFCGNKMVDGLPYCEAHARMAYRPSRRGPQPDH